MLILPKARSSFVIGQRKIIGSTYFESIFRRVFALMTFYCLADLHANGQEVYQGSYYKYVNTIDRKITKTKNLAFGIDFQTTSNYAVVSKTYVFVDGIYASALPSVKGFFPISKNLFFKFHVPYIISTKISSTPGGQDTSGSWHPTPLPGIGDIDFNISHGIGDIDAGLNWQHFSSRLKGGMAYSASARLIAPSGISIFEDSSEASIPLGSGFWTIELGTEFSKYFNYKFFVSLNLSLTARTKTVHRQQENTTNKSTYSTGNPIFSTGLDLGMLGNQNSGYSSKISLSYSYVYLGKSFLQSNQRKNLFRDRYKVHQLGLKWSASKSVNSAFTMYTGAQIMQGANKEKSDLLLLIDIQLPLGFNKVGFKLY